MEIVSVFFLRLAMALLIMPLAGFSPVLTTTSSIEYSSSDKVAFIVAGKEVTSLVTVWVL